MKKLSLILVGLATICLSQFASAEPQSNMTSVQKEQIEKIVHDYLINNPKVLIEASRSLQMQQREEMMQKAQEAIKESRAELFNDHNAFSGNAKGDVTLVEFFDFKCIHCKRMGTVINELTKNDKNLKVVYKQLPIFGGPSHYAAKASLAAARQKKYTAFHTALLNTKANLDKKTILQIAKKSRLNIKRFRKDMNDPKLEQVIDENMKLAQKIGIMGTPAFIVASNTSQTDKLSAYFMPGAARKPTLTAMINKARKDNKA